MNRLEAYDYEAQCWISGEPARQLLIQRAREEISLLGGPDGWNYLRSTYGPEVVSISQAISLQDRTLMDLCAVKPS